MDVEVDINEKFIADCAREAAEGRRKHSYPDDRLDVEDQRHRQADEREKSEHLTRQLETNKIQMMTTPGNPFNHLHND